MHTARPLQVARSALVRRGLASFALSCSVGCLGAGCERSQSPQEGARDAGGPVDAAASCEVTAPTSCPSPVPRYPDVQPIIQQRCVPCHSGTTDRWPLTTYQDVADWYDTVRDDVLTCKMPPPGSGIPMTVEERVAILTWIRCGFPP